MSRDILLNLPEAVSMSYLEMVPEFDKYNELMQRVVVMVLLHLSDERLLLDGKSLYQFAGTITTAGVDAVNRRLAFVASAATDLLNEDVDDTDTDNYIRNLSLEIVPSGRMFRLLINISTESENNITGALTIDG